MTITHLAFQAVEVFSKGNRQSFRCEDGIQANLLHLFLSRALWACGNRETNLKFRVTQYNSDYFVVSEGIIADLSKMRNAIKIVSQALLNWQVVKLEELQTHDLSLFKAKRSFGSGDAILLINPSHYAESFGFFFDEVLKLRSVNTVFQIVHMVPYKNSTVLVGMRPELEHVLAIFRNILGPKAML